MQKLNQSVWICTRDFNICDAKAEKFLCVSKKAAAVPNQSFSWFHTLNGAFYWNIQVHLDCGEVEAFISVEVKRV